MLRPGPPPSSGIAQTSWRGTSLRNAWQRRLSLLKSAGFARMPTINSPRQRLSALPLSCRRAAWRGSSDRQRTLGRAPDAILDSAPWNDAAFADEERLVDPRVALVAGFHARVREEVLVAVVGAATVGDRILNGSVQLEEAGVLDVEVRPVVGFDLYPHIDPQEA